jgi:ubiquitin C-terminal hydrolase
LRAGAKCRRDVPPVRVSVAFELSMEELHMPKCERASSTLAMAGSSSVPDNALSPVCLSCGDTMRHFRTIPKLGVCPELLVFHCPSCYEVEAKKARRIS